MAAQSVGKSLVSKLIRSKILMSGPIPVADYMRVALTQSVIPGSISDANTGGGYYMEKDVFGQHGDFITSPEISQMFGEMIAAWSIQSWKQIGGPKKVNIVELGPGRGTLALDMLRVFKQFENVTGPDVSLHLVEVSPYLAAVQRENICRVSKQESKNSNRNSKISPLTKELEQAPLGKPYYHATASKSGYPVYWYRDIKDLPKEFNLYIAHEFLDALPIHKLQKTEAGWREVLVDASAEDEKFQYVLSRNETPIIKLIRSRYEGLLNNHRSHVEISLDSFEVLEELTKRLGFDGGIAMLVDYGHEGTKEDTFRGFLKHKLHDPLINPGSCDLTADVDFSLIKNVFADQALIYGPVAQQDFLANVGIEHRLKMLLESCDDEENKANILSGYKMIMEDMGSRFLVMSLFPKVLEKYLPNLKIAGF